MQVAAFSLEETRFRAAHRTSIYLRPLPEQSHRLIAAARTQLAFSGLYQQDFGAADGTAIVTANLELRLPPRLNDHRFLGQNQSSLS